jgi:hypothetical protein
VIRQGGAHDASADDNDPFACAIYHFRLHSVSPITVLHSKSQKDLH